MRILENIIGFSEWKLLESLNASPIPNADNSLKVGLDSNTKSELISNNKIKDDKIKTIQDLAIQKGKIKRDELDKKTILYGTEKNDKGEEELIITVSKRVKDDDKGVMNIEDFKKLLEKPELKGKVKTVEKK